jgi:D-alanine-D-alanine ligase
MRVAILHNPRPDLPPDPSLPEDMFEEFDSPDTIAAITAALAGLGAKAEPVVADRQMPRALEQGRFDFVFNIAEGQGRRCREAIPAAVCELLGLPYTFSDPLTLAVTLDKSVTRRIVSPDVPVARGVVIHDDSDAPQLDGLSFPVVVKPDDEGSSKGIWRESFCRNPAEAVERCRWLRARYDCPVLVEEYLPGAEVTVAVRGNGASRTVLGMMEIAPADQSTEPFLYSIEVKREWRRRVCYHNPPRLDQSQVAAIRDYALASCRLLGCRDLARIDFRLDNHGEPRFLECNPLPGLNPENSDVVILSRDVLPYDKLVQGILLDAAARCKVGADAAS